MEGNPTSRTAHPHFYDGAYARLCYTDVEINIVNTVIAPGTNRSPRSDPAIMNGESLRSDDYWLEADATVAACPG